MDSFVGKPELAPGAQPSNDWRAVFSKDPEVALWPILIIAAVVILWLAEQGSQNCVNGKCHQIAPTIDTEDNSSRIINKIDEGLEKHWTFVSWRLAGLVAIFTGIIAMIIFWRGFPNGILAVTVFAFIFVGIYISFNYMCTQVIKPKVDRQRHSLKGLREKLRHP